MPVSAWGLEGSQPAGAIRLGMSGQGSRATPTSQLSHTRQPATEIKCTLLRVLWLGLTRRLPFARARTHTHTGSLCLPGVLFCLQTMAWRPLMTLWHRSAGGVNKAAGTEGALKERARRHLHAGTAAPGSNTNRRRRMTSRPRLLRVCCLL